MRNYDGMLELRPSLIGTLSYGLTAVGVPVDTLGFRDVMAVLVAGSVQGTDANQGTLAVKIQESASITGTGAGWVDIDNGDYNGTFEFDSIAIVAGTNEVLHMGKQYERLGGNRSRYIRAHATIAGTDSISCKFSVAFLLGRPNDTLYINDAVTISTGNVEVTPML